MHARVCSGRWQSTCWRPDCIRLHTERLDLSPLCLGRLILLNTSAHPGKARHSSQSQNAKKWQDAINNRIAAREVVFAARCWPPSEFRNHRNSPNVSLACQGYMERASVFPHEISCSAFEISAMLVHVRAIARFRSVGARMCSTV